MQRQFACLVKNDSRFDVELRTFLPRAYNFKAIADYQTGPGSQVSAAGAPSFLRVGVSASPPIEWVLGLFTERSNAKCA